MENYNIYAGLIGGFGGEHYCERCEFENLKDAEEYARESAYEDYESYGGLHDLRTLDDIEEEFREENDESDELDAAQQEDIDDLYHEVVEGWVIYHAVLASNDPDWDYENNCPNR